MHLGIIPDRSALFQEMRQSSRQFLHPGRTTAASTFGFVAQAVGNG
jgi:hypothetical protein